MKTSATRPVTEDQRVLQRCAVEQTPPTSACRADRQLTAIDAGGVPDSPQSHGHEPPREKLLVGRVEVESPGVERDQSDGPGARSADPASLLAGNGDNAC